MPPPGVTVGRGQSARRNPLTGGFLIGNSPELEQQDADRRALLATRRADPFSTGLLSDPSLLQNADPATAFSVLRSATDPSSTGFNQFISSHIAGIPFTPGQAAIPGFTGISDDQINQFLQFLQGGGDPRNFGAGGGGAAPARQQAADAPAAATLGPKLDPATGGFRSEALGVLGQDPLGLRIPTQTSQVGAPGGPPTKGAQVFSPHGIDDSVPFGLVPPNHLLGPHASPFDADPFFNPITGGVSHGPFSNVPPGVGGPPAGFGDASQGPSFPSTRDLINAGLLIGSGFGRGSGGRQDGSGGDFRGNIAADTTPVEGSFQDPQDVNLPGTFRIPGTGEAANRATGGGPRVPTTNIPGTGGNAQGDPNVTSGDIDLIFQLLTQLQSGLQGDRARDLSGFAQNTLLDLIGNPGIFDDIQGPSAGSLLNTPGLGFTNSLFGAGSPLLDTATGLLGGGTLSNPLLNQTQDVLSQLLSGEVVPENLRGIESNVAGLLGQGGGGTGADIQGFTSDVLNNGLLNSDFIQGFREEVFDPQREALLGDLNRRGILNSGERVESERELFNRQFANQLALQDLNARQQAAQQGLQGLGTALGGFGTTNSLMANLLGQAGNVGRGDLASQLAQTQLGLGSLTNLGSLGLSSTGLGADITDQSATRAGRSLLSRQGLLESLRGFDEAERRGRINDIVGLLSLFMSDEVAQEALKNAARQRGFGTAGDIGSTAAILDLLFRRGGGGGG